MRRIDANRNLVVNGEKDSNFRSPKPESGALSF
jgi:hypothetical protein